MILCTCGSTNITRSRIDWQSLACICECGRQFTSHETMAESKWIADRFAEPQADEDDLGQVEVAVEDLRSPEGQ